MLFIHRSMNRFKHVLKHVLCSNLYTYEHFFIVKLKKNYILTLSDFKKQSI